MHRTVRQNRKQNTHKKSERSSLGKFTNFSPIIHGKVRVTCESNPVKIQRAIIIALHKLNGWREPYPISLSKRAETCEGEVGFEVGVAEGIDFLFLSDEIVEKLSESMTPRNQYAILDFLVIVTYHYSSQGKNTRINFDHHQLRFLFSNDGFEMYLFQSKGNRRMPLDEFITRVINRITEEMRQQSLHPSTTTEL